MSGIVRGRLGWLTRGGDPDDPRPDPEKRPRPVAPLPLPDGATIASLAEQLDIGAHAFVDAPRHAYDLDKVDVPTLLASAAASAAASGMSTWLQLPGRCLPLTTSTLDRRVDDLDEHPRCRLLVTGPGGLIAENVAIERWRRADRAYRSLSDDPDVRLSIPDAPPPSNGPARTEASFDAPIDLVYTWVDSRDPAWREMAAPYLDLDALQHDLYTPGDELRHSLRSVEVFAPWVRRIHVLSNCTPPAWYAESERVRWVGHDAVADPGLLPLFNSAAIDTLLHRIPDLTEHFLYLNDDFFLWDSVTPATFFTPDDHTIARLAMNSSVIYLQQLVDAGRAAPSQHSRVNAARLLEDRYGVFHTRVHGHVPYALRRSAMEALEREFADEIAGTRASRTRQPSDVSVMAYLYHHVGHAKGQVDYAEAPPGAFVTRNNHVRSGARQALRSAPFICLQDSRDSATDRGYQAFRERTLAEALPLRSPAERA